MRSRPVSGLCLGSDFSAFPASCHETVSTMCSVMEERHKIHGSQIRRKQGLTRTGSTSSAITDSGARPFSFDQLGL